MLTSIFRVLSDHLLRLGLPFYLEDCVPPGASFPYITLDVHAPLAPHVSGQVILTYWCSDHAANFHRLFQLDLMQGMFPPRGFRLATDSGVAVFRPEAAAVCVRESAAQGVKTTWKLQFFPKN